MTAIIKHYASEDALLSSFVPQIASQLSDAIARRGHAYLVVSGGRTPVALFHQLRLLPMNWQKITVLLADDRWVDTTHADSNAALVREHLLKNQASSANFINLLAGSESIEADVTSANRRLAEIPTFDVVILGMGDDGHTASLFPCSEELQEGLQTSAAVLAVTPQTAPHKRLSLSRSRLLNSRQLYVQLKGKSKAEVVEKALAHSPTDSLPISHFLHQTEVPVQVLLADV